MAVAPAVKIAVVLLAVTYSAHARRLLEDDAAGGLLPSVNVVIKLVHDTLTVCMLNLRRWLGRWFEIAMMLRGSPAACNVAFLPAPQHVQAHKHVTFYHCRHRHHRTSHRNEELDCSVQW